MKFQTGSQKDTTSNPSPIFEEDYLLTAEQTAQLLKISRTKAYELIRSGEIPSLQLGRLVRVRKQDVFNYVEGLLDNH